MRFLPGFCAISVRRSRVAVNPLVPTVGKTTPESPLDLGIGVRDDIAITTTELTCRNNTVEQSPQVNPY